LDVQGRDLSETVWTRLDRKAGAVIELTIRQLRHKISTWVVLALGTILMVLLLAFYVDSIREGFESIDNDGDSVDQDRDGYPLGQERKYGTSDWNGEEYPGSGTYVYEGEIDWNDENREISGNKTWEGVTLLDATWIDTDYKGGQWDYVIDWDDVTDCPDTRGELFVDWIPDFATACQLEDGTYATNGKFNAEGNITVPRDYFLSYGYVTGIFVVPKDPKEMYIDEDDIDWDGSAGSQGVDDDGDCLRTDWFTQFDDSGNQMWWEEPHRPDANGNGIQCDVIWVIDSRTGEVISISADSSVDEDPVDENYAGEASHRTFVIATGKIAFVLLLGLFLPLFLSLGLVRDETERGTLHYLLSKPIHRGEFILYRVLGYLAVVSVFVLALSLVMGLITSIIGPGESLLRVGDLPVWLGIAIATILVLAAYGSLFNTIGLLLPKYGVYLCIVIGVWEFAMGFTTLISPSSSIATLSVSHWGLQLIDSIVMVSWPDTLQFSQMSSAFGLATGLEWIWSPPVHTLNSSNAYLGILTSATMLIGISVSMIGIGSAVFSKREIM
tara:strand:+ start:8280 stop:9944 length:1665 start_codon:yes stop_codon:yes gene_type:complete